MLFLTRTKRAAERGNGNRSVKLGRKTPKIQVDSSAYSVNCTAVSIMLDRVPELSRVGGYAAIVDDAEDVYLIVARTADSEFVVASSQCTHREKPLFYDHEARLFACASRKRKFRLDGTITEGEAEPLRVYDSHLEDGVLTVDLSSGSEFAAACA